MAASRRALLGGLATLPVVPVSAEMPDQSADEAFGRWLTAVHLLNNREPSSDEEMEAEYQVTRSAEIAIQDMAPSVMGAAALSLVELTFVVTNPDEPAGPDASEEVRVLLRILRHLRPQLTGQVAAMAGDLLDHPGRPYRQSLLDRSISNRRAQA